MTNPIIYTINRIHQCNIIQPTTVTIDALSDHPYKPKIVPAKPHLRAAISQRMAEDQHDPTYSKQEWMEQLVLVTDLVNEGVITHFIIYQFPDCDGDCYSMETFLCKEGTKYTFRTSMMDKLRTFQSDPTTNQPIIHNALDIHSTDWINDMLDTSHCYMDEVNYSKYGEPRFQEIIKRTYDHYQLTSDTLEDFQSVNAFIDMIEQQYKDRKLKYVLLDNLIGADMLLVNWFIEG